MKRISYLFVAALLLSCNSTQQKSETNQSKSEVQVVDSLNDCVIGVHLLENAADARQKLTEQGYSLLGTEPQYYFDIELVKWAGFDFPKAIFLVESNKVSSINLISETFYEKSECDSAYAKLSTALNEKYSKFKVENWKDSLQDDFHIGDEYRCELFEDTKTSIILTDAPVVGPTLDNDAYRIALIYRAVEAISKPEDI